MIKNVLKVHIRANPCTLNKYLYNISSKSSTMTSSTPPPPPSSSSIVNTRIHIPSNLIIEDTSIFEDTPSKISITHWDYLFPIAYNKLPESITAKSFLLPGIDSNVTIPLHRGIFSVALRADIVHEVIRYHRHKLRQPKKLKRMGEISGSGKKPRPQKGGGTGQVGNKRNSAWRKGQKAHGPVLRDYSIGCNRKFRAMGMMIALAAKYREGNLMIFDKLEVNTHKTKDLLGLLKQHGIDNETSSTLILDQDISENFATASNNLALVTLTEQSRATVYEILKKTKLVISASAFQSMQDRLWSQYNHIGKLKSFNAGISQLKITNY